MLCKGNFFAADGDCGALRVGWCLVANLVSQTKPHPPFAMCLALPLEWVNAAKKGARLAIPILLWWSLRQAENDDLRCKYFEVAQMIYSQEKPVGWQKRALHQSQLAIQFQILSPEILSRTQGQWHPCESWWHEFQTAFCKMLGSLEIRYGLPGVSVGLKNPTCSVHWEENFSDLVNLAWKIFRVILSSFSHSAAELITLFM